MFEKIPLAAPDPILGLTEKFKADPRTHKINLGVGVFKDAQGQTPVLQAVKRAEAALVESEGTKAYLPIDGDPGYGRVVQTLMLGSEHPAVTQDRAASFHTPGGTGALRVVAEYLKIHHPGAAVWLSDPTWANHGAIFEAAGVATKKYGYYDPQSRGLKLENMVADLEGIAAGDVVLLHGCCHNPTGVDPDPQQWEIIAQTLSKGGALPLVDFAYQGFGTGLASDAAGLRVLAEHHGEFMVCSSFSKNFGLYRERTGALTVVADNNAHKEAVRSQIKLCVRRLYSNPPSHGGAVVKTILESQELRGLWEDELVGMGHRIAQMRRSLAEALDTKGISLSPQGNGFITAQNGMFSFTGLGREQVDRLREEQAVYMVGSGRINVAGITPDNLSRLVDALASVI